MVHSRPSSCHDSQPRLERYVEKTCIVGITLGLVQQWRCQRLIETTLGSHDVAFPLRASAGHGPAMFRIILLSSSQANTPEARTRIDRLSMLDGDGKAAVILLLEEKGSMDSFMELQMWYVERHEHPAAATQPRASDTAAL